MNTSLRTTWQAKFRITQNQTEKDAFVYCADDTVMNEYMKQHPIKAECVPFSIKKDRW